MPIGFFELVRKTVKTGVEQKGKQKRKNCSLFITRIIVILLVQIKTQVTQVRVWTLPNKIVDDDWLKPCYCTGVVKESILCLQLAFTFRQ
jgi:hypothetical protein